MEEKIGIIDIGSTSIRLIIMRINENGSYRMIDQKKDMIRLSEGLNETGNLLPEVMQQALRCLSLFKKLCTAHQVSKILAVATAATRKAANGSNFLELIQHKTGIQVDIISGQREAYLDYIGSVNTMPLDSYILIDVGGGSTELVLVDKREFRHSVSIPMGAMNLSERFGSSKAYSTEELNQLNDYVGKELTSVEWLNETSSLPVVALGGTARTMAKINKYTLRYPLEGVHNHCLKPQAAFDIYQYLAELSPVKRRKVPGLAKERTDIIVGGLAPIINLIKIIQAKQVCICGNGLREGLFYEYYLQEVHKNKPVVHSVLEHSLENNLLNYDINTAHSRHVRQLALLLFDQLQQLHNLDHSHRRALETGALLHDVGRAINYYNHHAHSFYLILNARLNGLTHREKVIAAFVAGFHNSSAFKEVVKDYSAILRPEDELIIRQLAILVQIADLLDRSECGLVQALRCHLANGHVQVMLSTEGLAENEYEAVECTRKKFAKLFGKELWFV